jgi:hypothetical protein
MDGNPVQGAGFACGRSPPMRPSPSQMTALASLSARVTGDSSSLWSTPQVPACSRAAGAHRRGGRAVSSRRAAVVQRRSCLPLRGEPTLEGQLQKGLGTAAQARSPRTRKPRGSHRRLFWRLPLLAGSQSAATVRCSATCMLPAAFANQVLSVPVVVVRAWAIRNVWDCHVRAVYQRLASGALRVAVHRHWYFMKPTTRCQCGSPIEDLVRLLALHCHPCRDVMPAALN